MIYNMSNKKNASNTMQNIRLYDFTQLFIYVFIYV